MDCFVVAVGGNGLTAVAGVGEHDAARPDAVSFHVGAATTPAAKAKRSRRTREDDEDDGAR
jgi:hypothetical protein